MPESCSIDNYKLTSSTLLQIMILNKNTKYGKEKKKQVQT
jgi:hypothetical protein